MLYIITSVKTGLSTVYLSL